jgi:hypothetical protein
MLQSYALNLVLKMEIHREIAKLQYFQNASGYWYRMIAIAPTSFKLTDKKYLLFIPRNH